MMMMMMMVIILIMIMMIMTINSMLMMPTNIMPMPRIMTIVRTKLLFRCLSRARKAVMVHMDDACHALERIAEQTSSKRFSDGVSWTTAKLVDSLGKTLDELASEAQYYKPPGFKEAGWTFFEESSEDDGW